ncbi:sensor histidine kinase [Konateibacter massiliensis]|uniref:sensor histidine kinase n=1 Tax=Konateibacter massiliensis TaxID=2002841 RepID=UPI000C15D1B4|nr:sensor histidine kinase [Konateibacter massiliensis]
MHLWKFYINFFSKQNVRRQLLTIFVFVIMIPIFLVGSIMFFFSNRQLMQSYQYLVESDAIRVRSIVLTTMLPLYDIYETLAEDEALKDLLSADYQSDEEVLTAYNQYTRFQELLAANASLSTLKLYMPPELLRSQSDQQFFYPIDDAVRATDWYLKASSTSGNFWKSSLRKDKLGNSYWELSYYCHIYLPKADTNAILVMTVSNNHLRSLIKDGDSRVYIAVNEDPVFYSTVRSYEGGEFPASIDYAAPYYSETRAMKIEGSNALTSVVSLEAYRTNDTIYILSANMNALPYIWRTTYAFLLVLLFAVFIPALIFILFTKYFSTRIQTLRLAMHKVSNNDYEIVDSVQGDDELSEAFTDLKTMVEKIKKAEGEIYMAQIREQNFSNQQQQMELKLLINQINPHFLYNTLETIRMKAFSDGNKEVATAIKLLGKSMRYVLNNTKTSSTTLAKEIDYTTTYLSIQLLRFEARLNYSLSIDDNIDPDSYQILPLLLQPIVENAISHGIEPTGRKGHIIIRIRNVSNELLIADVFDNGMGMSKERLKDIKNSLNAPPTDEEHGIGLYNINNRIKLFYGVKYGLFIKSKEHFGTLVTLKIPLHNLLEEDL